MPRTTYAKRKAAQAKARHRKAALAALPMPLLGAAVALTAVAMAYTLLAPVVANIQAALALPM